MNRIVALLLAALVALVAAPAGAAETAATEPAPHHDEDCDRGPGGAGDGLAAPPQAPVAGPLPVAAAVGAGSCRGVRPGAQIVVAGTALCTLNFRFTGVDAGGGRHAYMGTAGHCAFGSTIRPPVQRVWPAGHGPVVTDSTGRRIGTFAYAIYNRDRDFGLVRLDAGVASHPQMCHFGGPTGLNREITSRTTTLHYFGQGIGVRALLPARSAIAHGMPHEGHVHAVGVAVPADSGAGVVSADGRAVGLVITTGLHGGQVGTSGTDVGTVGVARLAPVVNRAQHGLRQRLILHTAPRR